MAVHTVTFAEAVLPQTLAPDETVHEYAVAFAGDAATGTDTPPSHIVEFGMLTLHCASEWSEYPKHANAHQAKRNRPLIICRTGLEDLRTAHYPTGKEPFRWY